MTRPKPLAVPLFIVLWGAACGPAPVGPRAAREPPPDAPPFDAGLSPSPRETPDAGAGSTPMTETADASAVDASAERQKLPAPDADAAMTADAMRIDAAADAPPVDARDEAMPIDAMPIDAMPSDATPSDAMPIDATLVEVGDDATPIDGGTGSDASRARPPTAGELVITEVLVNPGGTDTGREWIEILNRAAEPLDLSALHVADAASDAAVAAGVVAAGQRLVLGQSADATKNGGAPVAIAYGTRLGLNNDGEELSLCIGACATGLVVDHVGWQTLAAAYDGHAVVFDRDDRATCPATRPFGTAGDFGTPGAADDDCPTPDAGF